MATDVTETSAPPEVRLLLPTRSRVLEGDLPCTQCRAFWVTVPRQGQDRSRK
ncbi:hypothetical protein L6E12_11860 [Actinokineospora sp. PR83]|uniref:hypothetical protein n=1 Tax=Actinokineospora sp. PR83 TaxID=2884908 RepID=UPI001F27BA22|nr:hypothetical protein [Actinokineospora sp. PR83]MCG8916486.1 hypothetical protein [Actinokineospora sp. PR83]